MFFGFLVVACSPQSPKNEIEATAQLSGFLGSFQASASRGKRPALDSLSEKSFQSALQKVKKGLLELESIDTAMLGGDDLVDWKFAHSILSGQALELGSMRFYRRDPRIYMGFTDLSRILAGPGSDSSKIQEVLPRLEIMPLQLSNGMAQLQTNVPRFTELAIFMAENAFLLFDRELPAFQKKAGIPADVLTEPAAKARRSLEMFLDFLKKDLPAKPVGSFAIGKTTYDSMLARQYLLKGGSDVLYAFGLREFEITIEELKVMAKKIDSTKSWQEGVRIVKRQSPAPARMIEAHQIWVDKSREHLIRNDLIPVPWMERVRVVPRAEYLRKTSYYGNFSLAKEKSKDGIFWSEWMINPYEEQWDAKRKKEYMEEHDWGVIMVTAPHETYGGHHIQGLYQMHNPRKIRRENGISIFSEGWGLYNEQLMLETGFFRSKPVQIRQLHLRLWRNARVIYDVGMHTGKMSYEDAIKLMTDKVGFLPWAAQLEVDAAAASPGYFIGYFTGMKEILKIREEFKQRMGEKYSLRDFHERLLKIGNMPPALMREALFNNLNQEVSQN